MLKGIKNFNIQKRLMLFVTAILLLSIGGVGAVSYMSAENSLEGTVQDTLPELAVQSASVVRKGLDVSTAAIEALAVRRIVDDNTPWKDKVASMSEEAERMGYMALAIVDLNGRSRVFDDKGSVADLKNRAYFKKALEGKANVSDVLISRATGAPVVIIAAPVMRNGKVSAVLYGRRDGNELSRVTNEIKFGKKGYAYMMSRAGVCVSHPNKDFVLKQRNFIKESETNDNFRSLATVLKEMKKGGRGFGEYVFQGRDMYLAYAPVKDTEWSIAVTASKEEMLGRLSGLQKGVAAAALVFAVIGLLGAYFTGRQISVPVEAAADHAAVLASGDFTREVPPEFLNRKDELGRLAHAFRDITDNLTGMIGAIVTSSTNLGQAIDQISAGNQTLSQRTSEQASALEEIASTIEEANSTIGMNYENSIEANRLANEATVNAEQGGEVSRNAVASINELNQLTRKIEEITNVINEISFQTNLLALNAAVEAARAGEQGRGFAVVAGEVRSLAQRSGDAAKEIGILVTDAVNKIEESTEKSNEAGTGLNSIIESIKELSGRVAEISASSSEQKTGMEQITSAVGGLDNMTQQNSAMVEETASASEEIAAQARELLRMMEKFKINGHEAKETEIGRAPENFQSVKDQAKEEKGNGKGNGKNKGNGRGNGNTHPANRAAEFEQGLHAEGFEEF